MISTRICLGLCVCACTVSLVSVAVLPWHEGRWCLFWVMANAIGAGSQLLRYRQDVRAFK